MNDPSLHGATRRRPLAPWRSWPDCSRGCCSARPGRDRRREGRGVPQLLDDLTAARQETLNLLASLSEEELAIRGEHPFWGPETSIEQVMRGIYRHDRLHMDDMRQAVER